MFNKRLALLLSLVMILSMLPMSALGLDFADMPNDWSTEALEKAVANGLLKGDEDAIRAGDKLTRAEMATIVNRSFKAFETSSLSKYEDVTRDDWFYDEMSKAVAMGTFQGDGRKLNPNNSITREEAFAVIARAFKLEETSKVPRGFSDLSEILSWATGEVYALVNNGYVQGSNGKLNPKGYITRAEFAKMMDNVIKEYVDTEGDYTIDVVGNLMVNTPGVILSNSTIAGDLIIGDGVGEGEVVLDDATVTGRVVVRGGGTDSIIIKGDSVVGSIMIAKTNGAVRVYSEDGTEIGDVVLDGKDDVILEGIFSDIKILADDVTVYAKKAKINDTTVEGNDSRVLIGINSTIKELLLSGEGTEVGVSGKVEKIEVKEKARRTDITVDEDGEVEEITVNSPGTKIEGKGNVTKVQANADEVVVKTEGTKVTAAKGTKGVKAGDKEVDEKESEIVGKEEKSKSSGTKRVRVSAISINNDNMNLEVGEQDTLKATIDPSNATNKTVSWSTSNKNVVTVDADDKLATVTAVAEGKSEITVTSDDRGLTDTLIITVVAPADKEIQSVQTLSDINVANGTNKSDIGLPSTIEVTLNDSSTETLDVSWDNGTPAYGKDKEGSYTFEGTLQLLDGISNSENHKAKVNVNVESSADKEIKSVQTLADINVANGTDKNDIGLPSTVEVTLDDSSAETLDVSWNDGTPAYDKDKEGRYIFEGALQLLDGISNSENHKVNVNVIVAGLPGPTTGRATATASLTNVGKVDPHWGVVSVNLTLDEGKTYGDLNSLRIELFNGDNLLAANKLRIDEITEGTKAEQTITSPFHIGRAEDLPEGYSWYRGKYPIEGSMPTQQELPTKVVATYVIEGITYVSESTVSIELPAPVDETALAGKYSVNKDFTFDEAAYRQMMKDAGHNEGYIDIMVAHNIFITDNKIGKDLEVASQDGTNIVLSGSLQGYTDVPAYGAGPYYLAKMSVEVPSDLDLEDGHRAGKYVVENGRITYTSMYVEGETKTVEVEWTDEVTKTYRVDTSGVTFIPPVDEKALAGKYSVNKDFTFDKAAYRQMMKDAGHNEGYIDIMVAHNIFITDNKIGKDLEVASQDGTDIVLSGSLQGYTDVPAYGAGPYYLAKMSVEVPSDLDLEDGHRAGKYVVENGRITYTSMYVEGETKTVEVEWTDEVTKTYSVDTSGVTFIPPVD